MFERHGAVCLVRLEKTRLGDLLVAHASDCHLLDGKERLCGKDHFARNVAVLHGMCHELVLCVDVKRAKNPSVSSQISQRRTFSSKGTHLSPHYDSKEKLHFYIRMPEI